MVLFYGNIKAWINNYIYMNTDAITHSCPNISGGQAQDGFTQTVCIWCMDE